MRFTRPFRGFHLLGVKFAWLWSPIYKGLGISHGLRRLLWLGWTHREWKRRGW